MRERIQRLSERGELVLVVALSFTYFVATSLVTLLKGVRRLELNTRAILYGVLVELLILGAVAAILHARGWSAERLGIRYSHRAALAGLPLGFAYLIINGSLATVALALMPSIAKLPSVHFDATAPLPLVLLFVIVNSVFEETLVTGYVIAATTKDGAAFAVTLSAFLRILYHLYQGPVGVVSIAAIGVLFGAVYWQYRTLWPLIVAHTLLNLFAFGTRP